MQLKLIYSNENVKRPVLAEAIVKTGVLINILQAEITPTSAEMVIDVKASGAKAEEVLVFLREAGLKVEGITKLVEFDRERCLSCGACVSACPAGAIRQGRDWRIQIDETKCIRCKICIHSCPVRVIEVF